MERRQTPWIKYILAFLITAFIFTTAVVANNFFNEKRIEQIRSIEEGISIDFGFDDEGIIHYLFYLQMWSGNNYSISFCWFLLTSDEYYKFHMNKIVLSFSLGISGLGY